MVDAIDLCEDAKGRRNPKAPLLDQSWHRSRPFRTTPAQPTLPTHFETRLDHRNTANLDSTTPTSRPDVSRHQAYPESFYVDFLTTLEHVFPWQTFATRHRTAVKDLRHIFFVLVTLPLANPDDNSRRLKVAEGAWMRFSEWRQAWEETVANIRAQSSQSADTEELEGSFGLRERKEGPTSPRRKMSEL